jgi:hypothetical protein
MKGPGSPPTAPWVRQRLRIILDGLVSLSHARTADVSLRCKIKPSSTRCYCTHSDTDLASWRSSHSDHRSRPASKRTRVCSILLFARQIIIQNESVLNDNLSSFQIDRADSRVHVDAIRSSRRKLAVACRCLSGGHR